jgi:site-specific DNA recombinase
MPEHNSTNGKPVRAVAYYRMSTTRQEASIGEQKEWAQKAVARERVEIVRAFEDAAVAGDEIARRPDFLAMLDFCVRCHREGDPVQAVVTWDADRFSRANSIVTNACLAQLIAAGVTRMLTAEGWVDFDDDMDRLFFNIKQDMAKAMYVKSLSRNVSRSCMERARRGLWTGGRRPYGYTLGPDGRLALADPTRAEAAAWVFSHYAAHDTSLLEMARALEARGVPPPEPSSPSKAPRWSRYNIYTILHNPIYTGDLFYNRLHSGKYHRLHAGQVVGSKAVRTRTGRLRACRNRGEDVIVVENAHPALVDRETFAAVQRKLLANRPGFKKGSTRRRFDWLFSGLVYCGDCGAPMWGVVAQKDKERGDGTTKNYQWRKYVCSRYLSQGRRACSFNNVHEDWLLVRVAGAIRDHFADPAEAAALARSVAREQKARRKDAGTHIDPLRKRLARLDREIDEGTDRLLRLPEDLVEAATLKVRKWKAERKEVAAELKALEAEAEARRADDEQADKVVGLLKHLGELIGKAPPQMVREVMQSLVKRIDLHFEHEDRGQRRMTRATHGTLWLNLRAAQFSNAGIELPMSLK